MSGKIGIMCCAINDETKISLRTDVFHWFTKVWSLHKLVCKEWEKWKRVSPLQSSRVDLDSQVSRQLYINCFPDF